MEKGSNGKPLVAGAHGGIVCRQFLSGSCRFGPSCHFSHELPSMPICRYFQKGVCWFGERCRYQHVPLPGSLMSESRRTSAPVVQHPTWGFPMLPGRRGSEPSLSPVPGSQTWGRRRSDPLVSGLVLQQPSFEHLPTDIVEEEEHGAGEPVPRPLQVSGSDSAHSNCNAPFTVSQFGSGPVCSGSLPTSPLVIEADLVPSAAEETSQGPSAGTETMVCLMQKTSNQQEMADGAAATLTGPLPEYEQSKDMACGICMDKVYEKACPQDRRFGILPNCSHAFCLGCIVTWRKTRDFQEEVIKACPQCRVKSPYYIPSKYWVSDGEPKQTLIAAFKEKSSKIRCTFFMRHGCCPFKSECIYRHDLPSGYQPRRCRSPTAYSRTLEELDGESLQLLHCFIALTLLDSDDFLDEDDESYLDDDYEPL
ncbi:makorin, ring finger protein, 4 isoform X3 [Brienomyrus brachyistius]|uniref:makorin, ring finger protein, 4 isoform X3 n=1 Tax=Brienomyrus brachyistius TaxID=42636 RepID=UPI0020B1C55D|nr:makorin, ring finger protein, 4 isoform X3 [Brienomyrus brachyistius]